MATEAEINALYQQYLGRDAEQSGLNYWGRKGEYSDLAPLTLAEIEWNIANSTEAQNYAESQELDILEDTTVDATGLDNPLLDDMTQKEKYDYWRNWIDSQIEAAGADPESDFFSCLLYTSDAADE